MNQILVLEHRQLRVLTTKQLADFYDTDVRIISNNFNRNQQRFKLGIHYFKLEGEDLRAFRSIHHFDEYSPNTPNLYLWTERGAARHAKILNTDKAWEVYEELEETYFSVKAPVQLPPVQAEELQALRQKAARYDTMTRGFRRIDFWGEQS